MSLETTRARAELTHQDERSRTHQHGCAACVRAKRGRRWAELCADGAAIHAAMRAAQRDLDHQRELDKQPAKGQLPLFAEL